MLLPDATALIKKPLRAKFPTGPGMPGGHPFMVAPSPIRFRVFVILAPHHLPRPTRIVSPALALLRASWIVGKSCGTRWVAWAKETGEIPKTASARPRTERTSLELQIDVKCA